MNYLELIGSTATIIGAMYGMLRSMLKDVHKEVEILQRDSEEFREELKKIDHRFEKMSDRLDGLYRVLLDRTYGKSPEDDIK